MMTRVFTILFIALVSTSIKAQTQVEALINDAKEFNAAYLNADFESYVDMTIPSVTELAGGKEIMMENTKSSYNLLAKSGTATLSIDPLKPHKFMFAGRYLQAILPQKIIQQIGETKFSKTVYYLANSADEGKTWTFLDLEPYDSESIKTFVPSVNDDIVIPTVETPEVIEE